MGEEKLNWLTLTVSMNGYVATVSSGKAWVFNKFEDLVEWMKCSLEEPAGK